MENYTYEQAVEYLYKIPTFAGKNSFENTKEFLHELGGFEKLNNVIHVAGTNGKGSVCSYVQSVLLKAGYSVGMFTSPHLVSINERICLNGKYTDDNTFVKAFTKVKRLVDLRIQRGCTHPAFFEFVFAIALIIFEEFKPDYIILETGLGGRLDATNIIEKPLACAITSIGLDHTEYLGDSIAQIAFEKAGIIKNSVPIVFDADEKEVRDVILKRANEENSKYIPVYEKNVKIKKIGEKYIDFLIKCSYDKTVCINLKSNALYQTKNVLIAVEILNALNIDLDTNIIKNGIENAVWHGRMQWIKKDFLIDGAHNLAGIDKVTDSILALNKNIILIFSAVADKNYQKMISVLCERLPIEEVIVTELNTHRRASIDELKKLFDIYFGKNTQAEVYSEKKVCDAVLLAESHLKKYDNAIIFAAGSLYLVGEIIELMQ